MKKKKKTIREGVSRIITIKKMFFLNFLIVFFFTGLNGYWVSISWRWYNTKKKLKKKNKQTKEQLYNIGTGRLVTLSWWI